MAVELSVNVRRHAGQVGLVDRCGIEATCPPHGANHSTIRHVGACSLRGAYEVTEPRFRFETDQNVHMVGENGRCDDADPRAHCANLDSTPDVVRRSRVHTRNSAARVPGDMRIELIRGVARHDVLTPGVSPGSNRPVARFCAVAKMSPASSQKPVALPEPRPRHRRQHLDRREQVAQPDVLVLGVLVVVVVHGRQAHERRLEDVGKHVGRHAAA